MTAGELQFPFQSLPRVMSRGRPRTRTLATAGEILNMDGGGPFKEKEGPWASYTRPWTSANYILPDWRQDDGRYTSGTIMNSRPAIGSLFFFFLPCHFQSFGDSRVNPRRRKKKDEARNPVWVAVPQHIHPLPVAPHPFYRQHRPCPVNGFLPTHTPTTHAHTHTYIPRRD